MICVLNRVSSKSELVSLQNKRISVIAALVLQREQRAMRAEITISLMPVICTKLCCKQRIYIYNKGIQNVEMCFLWEDAVYISMRGIRLSLFSISKMASVNRLAMFLWNCDHHKWPNGRHFPKSRPFWADWSTSHQNKPCKTIYWCHFTNRTEAWPHSPALSGCIYSGVGLWTLTKPKIIPNPKNRVVTHWTAFLILRNFVNSLHQKFSTLNEYQPLFEQQFKWLVCFSLSLFD